MDQLETQNQERLTADLAAPASVPRRFLMGILLLGLAGTGAELALAGHYEDRLQWIPLVLLAAAALAAGWHLASPSRTSVRVLRAIMGLFILAGALGMTLHAKGKMEFKKESSPSLGGIELFLESLPSQSPPLLAPGVLIQMGLLGLAYTYRHPALRAGIKGDQK